LNTIIYPPTIDYFWVYQRPQQILRELARLGYKVYFFNNSIIKDTRKMISKIEKNFYIVNGLGFNKIKIEGIPILWVSYPPGLEQVNFFKNKFLIFDAIDYPTEEFISWEINYNKLQQSANVIFATSEKLFNLNKKKNKNVFMLPNGADFKHFNKAFNVFSDLPFDLPYNKKPIVGYFGALATWIDWDLVDFLANKNKDFNFVFIGPFYNHINNLPNQDNIFYLGRKDYSKLPEYLQYFNVCIIPFKITSMTAACDPIKAYEYLSAGKDVVSTNLPELKKLKVIKIAKSYKEFNDNLRKVIYNKSNLEKERYIKIAKENSWGIRAEYADKIIRQFI